MRAEEPEINCSCSISCNESATKKMKTSGLRGINPDNVDYKVLQNGAQCCSNVFKSSISKNPVTAKASLNNVDPWEVIGKPGYDFSVKEQNNTSTLFHGSSDTNHPKREDEADDPKHKSISSIAKDKNVRNSLPSGSNELRELYSRLIIPVNKQIFQTKISSLKQSSQSKPRNTEKISIAVPEVCLLNAKGFDKLLICADIAEDGSFVFGGFLNEIRAWDMQYKMHDIVPRYQMYSDDGGNTGSESRSKATENAIIFKGHSGIVNGVSYHKKKQLLLSGSEDTTIKAWNLKDYKCIAEYNFHSKAVIDLCNSPNTAYFASAAADWTAAIWNYNYNKPLVRYMNHEGEITCIKFHPNCNYMATGSEDNTVHMWKTTDAELVRLFPGHKDKVTCLAFSPCGNYLTSADVQGIVKIWDIKSGQHLNSFLAHDHVITSVSYNKAGTCLAVGGFHGCLKIFDLQKLGSPLPEKEADDKFLAGLKNSFREFKKSPLDLVSDYNCRDRDVFFITFIKNNLLMGMSDHRQL